MLSPILYTRVPPSLKVLNQLLLPHQTIYDTVTTIQQGYDQIKQMKVRGAPAIGLVASLSLAVDLQLKLLNSTEDSQVTTIISSPIELKAFIKKSLDYLNTSRPTAVNLSLASEKLWKITCRGLEESLESKEIIERLVDVAVEMLEDDLEDNKNIGKFGGEFILGKIEEDKGETKMISVLTHCNTGSLATSGYGTALGIIRYLHSQRHLSHAYCTETRPYNQGSRLTAYELLHDQIPSTLICDSMVSSLLSSSVLPHLKSCQVITENSNKITAIIVGADRIARNGDTANKIGTYQLAVIAKHHDVMFIVAASFTSIDLTIKNGKDIVIEERSEDEVVLVSGASVNNGGGFKEAEYESGKIIISKVRVPPTGVKVWNPSFDVTPARLITAIVTEKGVFERREGMNEFNLEEFC
ncbi:10982_t:CDS:2 [Acaulospora colombiana]|uniref:10982_t:CDS:1 n=1 Tax=Acaulospora colombiana TaxID=27376 RepID=A0ACA9LE53_9GLOM|nr:10982_t:CDS:2 [Acaulospora colombiana]